MPRSLSLAEPPKIDTTKTEGRSALEIDRLQQANSGNFSALPTQNISILLKGENSLTIQLEPNLSWVKDQLISKHKEQVLLKRLQLSTFLSI